MNEQLSSGKVLIPLENIRVAKPCRADWDKMQGDHRVRFCGSCEKHVYNLSAMSKADAEKLITEKEGKLCVQYYRRPDGTILTDNCPVGLKIARRPFKFLLAGFAVLLASGASLMAQASSTPATNANADSPSTGFLRAVMDRFESDANLQRTAGEPFIKGDTVCPAPTPTPTPAPKPKE